MGWDGWDWSDDTQGIDDLVVYDRTNELVTERPVPVSHSMQLRARACKNSESSTRSMFA